MNKIIETVKIQFNLAFSMISEFIEICPDELWNKKLGGHIFWQQLLHTYTGTNFWFRLQKHEFVEPFQGHNVYPELEKDAETEISKEQLKEFLLEVKKEAEEFFKDKEDSWLLEPNVLFDKINNLDVISMQIRHIMYHVGYCNCILNENGADKVNWIDYFG